MGVLSFAIVTALSGPAPPASPRSDRASASATTLRPTYRGEGRTKSAADAGRDVAARDLGLLPWGDGYFYKGAPKERFDAEILTDGSVVFHVDPSVQVKVDGACLVAVCVQTKAGREHARMRARSTRIATAIAALLTEGATASSASTTPGPQWYGIPSAGPIPGSQIQGSAPAVIPGVGVQGRFGYLPPPQIAMSGFLDRTFALRLEMAAQAARADMLAAGQRLSRTLAQLWREPGSSPAERRARVLELWLDHDAAALSPRDAVLTKTLNDQLDRERRARAERARRKIIESVQRHLPPDSPHAFENSELAAFAAAHPDRPRFDPYAPPPAVPEPSEPSEPSSVLAPRLEPPTPVPAAPPATPPTSTPRTRD